MHVNSWKLLFVSSASSGAGELLKTIALRNFRVSSENWRTKFSCCLEEGIVRSSDLCGWCRGCLHSNLLHYGPSRPPLTPSPAQAAADPHHGCVSTGPPKYRAGPGPNLPAPRAPPRRRLGGGGGVGVSVGKIVGDRETLVARGAVRGWGARGSPR